MADPTPPLEADTRALIRRLVGDATPVGRLWHPSARCALWLVGVAGIGVIAWHAGLRADLSSKLRDPAYTLELVTFALATMLAAVLAWREAVPGLGNGRVVRGLAIGLVAVAVAQWLRQPIDASPSGRGFVAAGLGCSVQTILLAALPWCALLLGIRRGAPLAPARAGLLAGVAAFSSGALLVRLGCAMDDRLHLLVWHGLPLVVGTVASVAIGIVWLRRWRRSATG